MPFSIIRNDITRVEADAIVNTANREPAVGEGVDSAIYKAAGWEDLLAERRSIGRIEPGEAKATKAFSLPAKYIIHTVGPVWRGGDSGEQETLASCYRNSLELADSLGAESVAFPLIATGTFGFPKDLALSTAIKEISDFLLDHDINVILVVYNKEAFMLSGKIFSDVRSYIEESDVLIRSFPEQNRARREGILLSTACNAPSRKGMSEEPDRSTSVLENEEVNSTKPLSAPEEEFSSAKPLSAPDEEEICEVYEALTLDDLDFGKAENLEEPTLGPEVPEGEGVNPKELDNFLHDRGETFQQKLFHMIDRKRLDDRDVYKRANIDRKLFSKIKSNLNYNPTKRTVLALAIGMELNLDETVDLLRSAGLAFTPAGVFDRIVEYCIAHHFYNIIDINLMLFENDQPTLGA